MSIEGQKLANCGCRSGSEDGFGEAEAVEVAENGDGSSFGTKHLLSHGLDLSSGDRLDFVDDLVEIKEAIEVHFLAREVGHACRRGLEAQHEVALQLVFHPPQFIRADQSLLEGAELTHDLAENTRDRLARGA